jgi:uncharacterized protein (DUF1697 family)
MPNYVAFLRAINVGGHTVKMDQLRSLFEAMGFAGVETFIASGNVIFQSKSTNTASLERKIEQHLLRALGYEVRTFVRATAELAGVANDQPFSEVELNAKGNTLYVGFLADQPSNEATKKVLSLCCATDALAIKGREVYWLCRTRFGDSAVSGALLEKTLTQRATLRNINTVVRIAAKYS